MQERPEASRAPTSPAEEKQPLDKKALVLRIALAGAAVAILLFTVLARLLPPVSGSVSQVYTPQETQVEGSVYEMTVTGGAYFQAFLDQGGASSRQEVLDFLARYAGRAPAARQDGQSLGGGSAFTAAGAEDAHRLFARNYDFAHTDLSIVHTQPGEGRHSAVSTVDLGSILDGEGTQADQAVLAAAAYFPLDGMNDAGVPCAVCMSTQGSGNVPTDQQSQRPDLTSTTLIRLILDYADSVEEAIALAGQYDLHDDGGVSFHYFVADASGDSAVLEWVGDTCADDGDGANRQLQVVRAEGVPFQTVTDYVLWEGYYAGQSESVLQGLDRNRYLYDRLTASAGTVSGVQGAMELLEEVGGQRWANGQTTVHSVVYDLTELSATWVDNERFGQAPVCRSLK